MGFGVMNYSVESCNIRECTKPHFKTFLCNEHYAKYATDEKIKSYLERQERIVLGNSTLRDQFIYWRNGIIHYLIYVSTYYIEHFKLETLFTYHYKNTDLQNNSLFDAEDFIHDF